MKPLFRRPLHAVIGTVQSVSGSVPVECCLQLVDGSVVTSWLPTGPPCVQRGDEVSVIVVGDGSRASVALGLVNHTVIDGENYVRQAVRLRPDIWDGILLSAGLAGSVSALGVDALMPFGALAATYWVFAVLISTAWREGLARRVDRLLDREARRHRPAFRSSALVRPASPDGDGR